MLSDRWTKIRSLASQTGDAMEAPVEDLPETNPPYAPRDNLSLTVAVRGSRVFFSRCGATHNAVGGCGPETG